MKLILIARVECRQVTNRFQMVSPLLHVGCCDRGERGRRPQGRTEAAQGKRKGREGAGHGGCLYRRNLNLQRPRFNYSHVIHPTSESSMWISKRMRFNEIFASTVSDRPSEQRFKKSNFHSTPEPLSNIFFGVTSAKTNVELFFQYLLSIFLTSGPDDHRWIDLLDLIIWFHFCRHYS
jgi:hypothetical protein